MRVFVAGASGAIGRPLVRQLLAAGHEVTGMTRREERAEAIRAAGAEAVVCDVFDADGAARGGRGGAAGGRRPRADGAAAEVRAAEATTWRRPTGCGREGTRNLVAAARAAGARRLVAESVAFFYEPEGGLGQGRGGAAVRRSARALRRRLRGAAPSSSARCSARAGLEGLVLRFGWFYGPGTYYDRGGSVAEETLKRRNPIVGAGTGSFSFVHVEDAAAAIVAALDHGAARRLQRRRRRAGAAARVAAGLRARRSARSRHARSPPGWRGWSRVGPRRRRGGRCAAPRNAKAKRELGWQPAHPSWRQGFRDALAA